MNQTLLSIARSWYTTAGVHTLDEILEWIRDRNETVSVDIRKNPNGGEPTWFYDREEGCIRNQAHSFFTIRGLRRKMPNGSIVSQPAIFQMEVSYLGLLCQEIGGVMHFLMQAKVEPGNINKVQLSPTIQATKSNFMQMHGGSKPPYLDYFINAGRCEVVADQLESEQSSRFYKKRNRNIIVRVEEDIPVLPSHCWMTLGQIKHLMRRDNLVNMDSRTVISCIPFLKLMLSNLELLELSDSFRDKQLFCSVFVGGGDDAITKVYGYINEQKMFSQYEPEIIPLHTLPDWTYHDGEWVCEKPSPFKIIFCDISIEGREVGCWTQPLLEATGVSTLGLLCCEESGVLKFLVRATPEIGCFDGVELGPTVQREAVDTSEGDEITRFFLTAWTRQAGGGGGTI